MKFRAALTTVLLAAPVVARAHPGHDGGHDLEWDFGHFASHPLATLACFALVAAAGWAAWRLWRAPKSTDATRIRRDR
jgi:hypothetical protein